MQASTLLRGVAIFSVGFAPELNNVKFLLINFLCCLVQLKDHETMGYSLSKKFEILFEVSDWR